MNKSEYTTLTQGRIKVLLAHDGNYNHPVIERFMELQVLDEDENIIKTISLPAKNIDFGIEVEISEENKDLLEFLLDMNNYHNS